MNPILIGFDGVKWTSSEKMAGMIAASSRAFTGVRKRLDTLRRAELPGKAPSRAYENVKRAAAAWIAVPQLKKAKLTSRRMMSWIALEWMFELMMYGTPPASDAAVEKPFGPAGMARMSAATSTKLVTPPIKSDETMALGTRRVAPTTSSATSPADSNP